jgi:hypothetical protein
MQRNRRPNLVAAVAFVLGMGVFVGVRWPNLRDHVGHLEAALWLTLPIALTYVAAAATALILVKDRVLDWWWMPAALFVLLGVPVDSWIVWTVISTKYGFAAGAIVDALAILAPPGVLVLLRRQPAVKVRDRLIPAVLVVAVSAVLSMRIGIYGPDTTLSVGVALLALGIFSQSTSWRRAVLFVVIALALGSQVPSSMATAFSQHLTGPVAWVDASLDVAIALLAFSIAPLARVTRNILHRRATSPVADSA